MTPNINTVGKFEVASPFDHSDFFIGDVVVISIENFGSIISKGKEPYTEYYQPMGIDLVDYKKDIKAKANIVRFKNGNNLIRDVPDTYIKSVPTQSGYEYVPISIVTQLPHMWTGMSYDHLIGTFNDMCLKILGVEPVTQKVVVIGESNWLDDIDHNLALLARAKAKEDISDNVYIKLDYLTKQNAELIEKVKILEAAIKGEITLMQSKDGDLFDAVVSDFTLGD